MLKAEDVKVGMRVNPKELWNIVGVAFILTNFEGDIGEVVYKGEPYTEECERIADEITSRNGGICFYYEPYDDEEVSWDE